MEYVIILNANLPKTFTLVGLCMGMGIKMGKTRVDERGRVTLPGALREEMGLYPGKEVNVEKARKGVLIRPVVSKKAFIQSLEGCITEKNQAEKLDPLKLKKIWGPLHAHD